MNKLRVLLADDHPVVREGVKALVTSQADMEVVGEATTGRMALELVRELEPNVVVLDLTMPDLGGIETTEIIRRDYPSVRVLMLTIHELECYLRRVLEAGASGYISKRSAPGELVRAIRLIAAGNIYIDSQLAAAVVADMMNKSTSPPQHETGLTSREAQVVKLLARGLINREIADRLDLSIKTVEVHKARALEKLGLRTRADVVRYALGRGWLEPAPN